MVRRIRSVVFVLIAAAVGAVLGRLIAEARQRQEAGEDIAAIDVREIRVRAADLVPGLVAAVRVHDQPWSWMRIPSWMAALSVNMAVGAVGGNIARLREMGERAAFDLAGVELPGRHREDGALRYRVEDYDAELDPHAPAPGEPWSPNQAADQPRRDPGMDEPTPGYTSLME